MKHLPLPPVEELVRLLAYSSDTGHFTWLKTRGFKANEGTPAGTPSREGYVLLCINGRRYLAHRIAFKIGHLRDPRGLIDHINGNKADNRLANLREAAPYQNQGNSVKPINNSSGVKGVHWSVRDNRWVAQIKKGKKRVWLGAFVEKAAATAAYRQAAREHFGQFHNDGEGL